jgi:hypothetical protein
MLFHTDLLLIAIHHTVCRWHFFDCDVIFYFNPLQKRNVGNDNVGFELKHYVIRDTKAKYIDKCSTQKFGSV